MAAGLDTRELYRVAVSYKSKLGPFATPRILNEYLKAVFRAPDLSSQFVEAMDTVVNQLLKVKDQELVDAIAEIAREVCIIHTYTHTHTHTHARARVCVYVCGCANEYVKQGCVYVCLDLSS
jgi:hypothetical protein